MQRRQWWARGWNDAVGGCLGEAGRACVQNSRKEMLDFGHWLAWAGLALIDPLQTKVRDGAGREHVTAVEICFSGGEYVNCQG